MESDRPEAGDPSDAIHGEHGADAGELLSRLEIAEARCRNLQDAAADLSARLEALRHSVRYRVGDAILRGMGSPTAMLRLPAELAGIYRAHRDEQRRRGRLLASPGDAPPASAEAAPAATGFPPPPGDAGRTTADPAGHAALLPGVTVVVPAYGAAARIGRCLETLAAQTLDRETFEAVIVLNGPDDGTRAAIEDFAAREPSLAIRVLESDPPGAGAARNAGLEAARFDHACFLDDDDELTPDYLEKLHAASDGRRVVIAPMSDVAAGGRETANPLGERLRSLEAAGRVGYRDVAPAFSLNAAKLAPTALLRGFSFAQELRSGEDVVFWADVCTRAEPPVAILPHGSGARYIRHVREDSVSRRPPDYDFSVAQRLAVIARLDALYTDETRSGRPFLEERIEAQARFVIRYLQAHPQDYPRAAAEIVEKAFRFPLIRLVNARLARMLVYSACFPPYLDPSGIVMAKRIAAMDGPADVISNGMTGARRPDPRLLELAASRLGHLEEAGAAARFAQWPAIAGYVDLAGRLARSLEAGKGAYAEIYSRALWPASHFAAAVHKLRNPQARWTAEFSDPILKDMRGEDRPGRMPVEWLVRHGFREAFAARGFDFPEDDRLFFWCEALPIALADRLVVTNPNQLAYMAGYQRDEALRAALLAKAVVSPHPVPAPRFYALAAPDYPVDEARTNIAYFGSFYANRGLEAVLDAMAKLPAARRDRLTLHVFTQQQDAVRRNAARRLGGSLRINPYVGYLDFLALTRRFDYLLALDADTSATHPQNPFLPSKLADYTGSGRPVWALFQPGSPMSSTALPAGSIRTRMGDAEGVRQALEGMGRP